MSVLVDSSSRVLIYGIAGNFGRFSARDLAQHGTKVVAGVAPGRDQNDVEGVPVFADARAACTATGADAALVYVPAPAALDAVLEVLDAGCKVIVYPGDGLPVQDAAELRAAARRHLLPARRRGRAKGWVPWSFRGKRSRHLWPGWRGQGYSRPPC